MEIGEYEVIGMATLQNYIRIVGNETLVAAPVNMKSSGLLISSEI